MFGLFVYWLQVRIHGFRIQDSGFRKKTVNHSRMTKGLIPGYRWSKKTQLYRYSTIDLQTAQGQCVKPSYSSSTCRTAPATPGLLIIKSNYSIVPYFCISICALAISYLCISICVFVPTVISWQSIHLSAKLRALKHNPPVELSALCSSTAGASGIMYITCWGNNASHFEVDGFGPFCKFEPSTAAGCTLEGWVFCGRPHWDRTLSKGSS